MEDIRDQAHLSADAVKGLNFIKNSGFFEFRKYYRSGLRSHIFEVVLTEDVKRETRGEIRDGARMFPKARPQKMFRIFRSRFESKDDIFREIRKYKLLLNFLGKEFIARSEEFIVDYRGTGVSRIVLCGLQEYVEGQILDPWRLSGKTPLEDLYRDGEKNRPGDPAKRARKHVAEFTGRVRQLIRHTGYIPDLAGIGNLILTPMGRLKLVDINNIVEIRFDPVIRLDDRGYPSCDSSVEALFLLESRLLGREIQSRDPLFRHFLTPERQKKVRLLEREFYKAL
ncbi:hypothetical protein [Desulfospira joergensenii]|uniref:hypothetical protein n=1 Tax=Desulfospira joergensenii TaxID=53329 RepID=UPI0003B6A7EF|nr:hypothetical protein [Desulfospira joergensenii]